MVISDNFVIRPNLINEARFGFTTADILPTTGLRGVDFIAATGLKLIAQNPPDITGSTLRGDFRIHALWRKSGRTADHAKL